MTVPGTPHWAVRAAHLTALLTLPSGLWRVALVVGLPVYPDAGGFSLGESAYVLSLSLVSEALAYLTVGLVAPWGETVPRWIPFLGGRRVPPLAATVPAALGAVALTTIWAYATYHFLTDMPAGTPTQQAILIACYAPLLAWGPLLAAVTVAYHRRRRAPRPALLPA